MELLSMSTTIRNPNRLIDFLKTIKEMDGEPWNNDNQQRFQILLIKNRYYVPLSKGIPAELSKILGDPLTKLSEENAKLIFEAKNYSDPAMRGRTSLSPLTEFGFTEVRDGKVCVTELGNKVLNKEITLYEAFMKWALKWQFPNLANSSKMKNGNVKPLVACIHLIKKLNDLCTEKNLKVKGISKNEFSLFVTSLNDASDIPGIAEKVLEYRTKEESFKGWSEKSKFFKNTSEIKLGEYNNFGNLKDYSDNLLRYFLLTDLLTLRGGGNYIDLSMTNVEIVKWVLDNLKPTADTFNSKEDYKKYITNVNLPEIVINEKGNIETVKESIKNEFGLPIYSLDFNDKNDLKSLKQYRKQLLNMKYKLEKRNKDGFNEVIINLENIRNLEIKPFIALEYWVTQGLILINDSVEIKPNYLTDEDNNIIFTASGGKGDIECYYEGFNTLCEVTLLTNKSQWFNEGQPIMRHLKDFNDLDKSKDTYCLFISPKTHRDTLNTFWTAVKYEYESERRNIIPITIYEFIELLKVIRDNLSKGKFNAIKLKQFYDNCVDVTNITDSQKWYDNVKNQLNSFKGELL